MYTQAGLLNYQGEKHQTKPQLEFREMTESYTLRSSAFLPFAIEKSTQTIYVLLAQIASSSRRGCVSTALWGDLGGTCEGGESSEKTAAREFAEESLSAVRLSTECRSVRGQCEWLENELNNGRFFLRLRITYGEGIEQGSGETINTHCRDFYMKEIPFDPSISQRFEEIRKSLLKVPEGIDRRFLDPSLRDHPALDQEDCIIAPHFLEKQKLQWFSLDRLMDILAGNGRHRGIRLRRGFIPALEVAVSELLRFVPEV
jgi:hypothetical protein